MFHNMNQHCKQKTPECIVICQNNYTYSEKTKDLGKIQNNKKRSPIWPDRNSSCLVTGVTVQPCWHRQASEVLYKSCRTFQTDTGGPVKYKSCQYNMLAPAGR